MVSSFLVTLPKSSDNDIGRFSSIIFLLSGHFYLVTLCDGRKIMLHIKLVVLFEKKKKKWQRK